MSISAIASPSTLVRVLANYAGYHRDKRNIFTHFFGVPLIVFGVQVLLARAGVSAGGVFVSAMWLATARSELFDLRKDILDVMKEMRQK